MYKHIVASVLLATVAVTNLAIATAVAAPGKNLAIDPNNLYPQVKLETTMGDIIVELDRVKAPITVDNFLTYVVTGEYNNTMFHRVIEGFVVQGGGYTPDFVTKTINDNIVNESGNGLKNVEGTIAMAKENSPHSANRQFFFNMNDNKDLDPGRRWGFAVFGEIVEGQQVVEAISKVKTHMDPDWYWEDVPVEPVVITKATLLPAQ